MFIALFIVSVAITLALFDAVLRQQYRAHRAAWQQDGSPWGFFSFTREVDFLPGCRARGTIFRQWLFRNPQWAGADPAALRYLVLFRASSVAAVILWAIGTLRMLQLL